MHRHVRRPGEKNLDDELVEFLDGDFGGVDDALKRPAIDLLVQRHGDGRTPRADQPYVATSLAKDGIAERG